ncbi:DUF1735 domain-containing protein [Deminuibacter soli]|uniref:DUF1735 domain-containing protein n=1 Tax=Deminuibacter soli TaxID=2291815 RepID=A0A3E1NRL0_9BACT|nr:DUF1735 domain-containing protein [Deminuibacter soli]RFM30547.1 DUF1735 domain-containing protein [Deminuibacter soli]
MRFSLKHILPVLAATAMGATSCLKDAPAVDPSQSNSVVEFANTGSIVSGANAAYARFSSDLGVLKTGDSAKFNVNVSYSGADAAPTDITVNLAVDTAALTAYNNSDDGDYVAPPTTIYKVPSSVVIKKGTHQSQVQVTVVVNASYDFNVNYALPLTIASASSGIISGNFGKAIYSFSARNSYDGKYTITGTFNDTQSGAFNGWYPLDEELITYSGNSIALKDVEYSGNYGHPFYSDASGSKSYYGNFAPIFYFDASGNVTSVTNYYGQATNSQKRAAQLDPTGINKITFNADGSVKSFAVTYWMVQAGVNRTKFDEVFTYTGAR